MFPAKSLQIQRRNTVTVSSLRPSAKGVERGILKKSLSVRSKSLSISYDEQEKPAYADMNHKQYSDDEIFVESIEHRSKESTSSTPKHVMFSEENKCHVFEGASDDSVESSQLSELWSKCPFFQEKGLDDQKARDGSLSKEGFEREPDLVICFTDPCVDLNFTEELKNRKIKLERCKVRERHILGIVLVQDLESSERFVFVRYSTDKGETFIDVEATCTNDDDEHFTFDLEFPQGALEMEFVVWCKCSSVEYWDDNFGEKYKVQDIHRVIALENEDQ